jgi:hypothetical protein
MPRTTTPKPQTALTTTAKDDERKVALMRAIGLDTLAPPQRELALNIAQRYDLDLLLKHLVLIEGRAYITRDGLLHVAHRSGQLDGIEVTEPSLDPDGLMWRATARVYRKDMGHPFVYSGRYPAKGPKTNERFAPEMATKVAEVMALRRAFDVAMPTQYERWDREDGSAPEDSPAAQGTADVVSAAAQAVVQASVQIETPPVAAQDAPSDTEATPDVSEAVAPGQVSLEDAQAAAATVVPDDLCNQLSPYDDGLVCDRKPGHPGVHWSGSGKDRVTW